MFEDLDNTPQHGPKKLKVLDKMSVEELRAYVQELQEEILRVQADIVKKQQHQDAVAGLFKK